MTNPESKETVSVGSWVKIVGFEPGEEETYSIVEDAAAQPTEMKIGRGSALAKALLGKSVGDSASFETPVGQANLKIVDVGDTE